MSISNGGLRGDSAASMPKFRSKLEKEEEKVNVVHKERTEPNRAGLGILI